MCEWVGEEGGQEGSVDGFIVSRKLAELWMKEVYLVLRSSSRKAASQVVGRNPFQEESR